MAPPLPPPPVLPPRSLPGLPLLLPLPQLYYFYELKPRRLVAMTAVRNRVFIITVSTAWCLVPVGVAPPAPAPAPGEGRQVARKGRRTLLLCPPWRLVGQPCMRTSGNVSAP